MKEKVLKIIGNLLLILGGFYLIFSPSNTFSSIVYVIGLLLVIYGGIIVVYSLIDKDSLTVFGNVLFSGLINILLGIILMVNKNGTIMMLSRLLGVWLIVKSLFSLSLYYGSNIKDKKEIITDLVKLVLGILILTTPIVSIIFTGTVIKRQNSGLNETFTVRKISYGVGVEKTFPTHSPKIAKIEVKRVGKVRRARLYYLRDRVGKAAKTKEKIEK